MTDFDIAKCSVINPAVSAKKLTPRSDKPISKLRHVRTLCLIVFKYKN